MAEEYLSGVRDDGSKIKVSSQKDLGESSKTGAELMEEGKTPSSPIPITQAFGYGDPQNPFAKKENKFYGHYLPEHFKKTNIINTKGRVR